MSVSTASPSIWWNMNLRRVGIVAAIDLSRHDNAHGRLLLFIVRTCTGEVCVRSSSGPAPASPCKRIHIVARRVVLGILSAQSCSTEFPSPACDHRVAKAREKSLDLLERLAQRVREPTGRITPRQRKISRSRASAVWSTADPMRGLVVRTASTCAFSELSS